MFLILREYKSKICFLFIKYIKSIILPVNYKFFPFYSINKKSIEKGVSNTNKIYNGVKINTSRILFVHGTIDPWRTLGVTSTKKNNNLELVVIKGKRVHDVLNDYKFFENSVNIFI